MIGDLADNHPSKAARESSMNLIRAGVEKEGGVYFVDSETRNYDLVKFELLSIGKDNVICTVKVPEKYVKIYRSEKINLAWNERTKHLTHLDMRHWTVCYTKYEFGRNLSQGKYLRRQIITTKINELHSEVERLIVLKHEA